MTAYYIDYYVDEYISTHTLTWSVTKVIEMLLQNIRHFNSHAHVERDISCKIRINLAVNFNSHAHVERDHITTSEDSHP